MVVWCVCKYDVCVCMCKYDVCVHMCKCVCVCAICVCVCEVCYAIKIVHLIPKPVPVSALTFCLV